MNFKALTEETGGQYWEVEGLANKHMAVPLHSHTREDEIWFVLDGRSRSRSAQRSSLQARAT